MIFMLAAVGTTVAALFELTVVPYLRVGDATPHLVFVLAVVVVVAVGFEAGLVWAFVGGLVLDVLAQRPIGSSAFALLLCVAAAAALAHSFTRLRPIVPIPAVFILSFVYSMSIYLTLGALRGTGGVEDPVAVLVPGAVYDTVLALFLGPLAVALHDRRAEQERVDW